MLKYRLEVRGRPPGDVTISAPGSFHGWSMGDFSEVSTVWPTSLVATLPLVGVTWRSCAALCTNLQIIADRRGNMAF
jgi:hypothetical protein